MPLKGNTSQVVVAMIAFILTTPAQAQSPKLKMTTDIPKSITAADAVETSIGTLEYFDGVPQPKTVETVYDYLDRSRAVQVFLNSIPAMSVATLREGQASVGADTCNKICIWDTLMDSESLLLTGNTSTMYAVGFLDLQKDGPSVIDLPPEDAGHPRRHGIPLHDGPGCGRSRQRQGRQVSGAAAGPPRRRA